MRNLTIISGPAAGQKLEVVGEVVIGREHSDLDIADVEISRQHTMLREVAEGVEVEDLGSMNGTFVNGERIAEPVTLAETSKLRIGTTEMELEIALTAVPPEEPVAQPDVTAPRQTMQPPEEIAQPDVTAPRRTMQPPDEAPPREEIPQPDVTAPRQAMPQPDPEAPREGIPQPDVTAPRQAMPPQPDPEAPQEEIAQPDVTAPRRTIPQPDVTAPRAIPQPDVTAPRAIPQQPDVTAPRQTVPQPDVTAPRAVPSGEPPPPSAPAGPAETPPATEVLRPRKGLSPALLVVVGVLVGAAIVALILLLA